MPGVDVAAHARDDGREVAVADRLLAVGVRDDGAVDLIELLALERDAELFAAALHGVAAGVLAENERRLRHADVFRPHDLVGPAILEHAVLVDPGLVREGVAADDGLVRLDVLAGQRAQQLARREDLARVDRRVVAAGCRRARA